MVGETGAAETPRMESTALSAGVGCKLALRSERLAQVSAPENSTKPRKLKSAMPHSCREKQPAAFTEQRKATPAAIAPARKNSTTPTPWYVPQREGASISLTQPSVISVPSRYASARMRNERNKLS